MTTSALAATIKKLSQPGTGILAADESTATIAKRFDSIKLESTADNRCEYRRVLFSTPDLGKYISGAILYEETLMQKTKDSTELYQLLLKQGILPGIKVDKGLIECPNTKGEKITYGLDGLAERFVEYKKFGAAFAKWRAVFNVSNEFPSRLAVHANAERLAHYAAICQSQGIVPIVEPEVLMDGNHSIERCAEVTEEVLTKVFKKLRCYKVMLEYMILKPNMVVAGKECGIQPPTEKVASMTLDVLRRTVPAIVPTINFLSGGQSDEEATANLNAINALPQSKPWNISYSYGRALQNAPLKTWAGKTENIEKSQAALIKRSKLNSAAALGEYNASQEK